MKMTRKVILFLLIVFCSIWRTSGSNADYQKWKFKYADIFATSLFEEADITLAGLYKLWEKIPWGEIQRAWNHSGELAKQTYNNIKEFLDPVIEVTQQRIKEKENELRQTLNELRETAKELGGNFKECLAEKENDIEFVKEVIWLSVTKIGQCVANKVSSDADDLAQSIRNIIISTTDFKDILVKCTTDGTVNIPKCLASVSDQIIDDAAMITSEVIQSSKSVGNIVSAIQKAVPSCATENVIEVTASIAKLAFNVGACVKNKSDAARMIGTELEKKELN